MGEPPSIQIQSTSAVTPPSINTADPSAPYSTSFNHIVELISSGQPIPGIKEIPDTVLEGQATQAAKPQRKKPWEKDAGSGNIVDNSGL